MKKFLIVLGVLVSVSCFAQENNQEVDNTESSLSLSRVEEDHKSTDVDSVIRSLNEKITILSQELSSKDNSIQDLRNQINMLQNEKTDILESLQRKDSVLSAIDSIVYKQCLIRPLYRRYDSKEIKELIHCLDAMNINNTHTESYSTYYPLLKSYESLNNEVRSFLERRKQSYEKKEWTLDWDQELDAAEMSFKRVSYHTYYEKRNIRPWKSIVYLDEVIDDFFKLLSSKKLNQSSLNDLIGRLVEKH